MRYVAALGLFFCSLALVSCDGGSAATITVVPGSPTAPAGDSSLTPAVTSDPVSPTAAPTATPTPGDDGSIVVPCGDPLVPVDKLYRLPADCAPASLVTLPEAYSFVSGQLMTPETADALMQMLDAAAADGLFMYAASSYRSYDDQVRTFQMWVDRLGEEEAERQSARPGHSEHQLGTTTDLTTAGESVLENFRNTPEADWVLQNSWRYGFIVSYPEGMEAVTGYVWEPWHIRFVGVDVAAQVHDSGLTLGEFLRAR